MQENTENKDFVMIDENHIIVKGKKYIAQKNPVCLGCALNTGECELIPISKIYGVCTASDRKDKTSISWHECKENPIPYDQYIENAKKELGILRNGAPVLPSSRQEFCKMCTNVGKKEWRMDMETGNIYPASLRMRSDRRDAKYDKYVLPSKEMAEAFKAMMQLIQLRDCYNGDWVPDWSDWKYKYTIKVTENKITFGDAIRTASVMAFKTDKLRDKFLENFRDLLEEAKPLL